MIPGANGMQDEFREVLNEMVALWHAHADRGECSARGCIGESNTNAITTMSPSSARLLAMVAVDEVARGRVREAELRLRLDVQRGMYAGLTRNVEEISAEADELRGRAEVAEGELADALAELTAWEDSAGPVGKANGES